MMYTPEEKALIEAVGRHDANNNLSKYNNLSKTIKDAYDAYMASLTTPPSCLPPAPKGKKWARVEYPDGWGDAKGGDCIVNPPDPGFFVFSGCGSEYCRGLAQVLRHGWRLEDDPEADSLAKIAGELECLIGSPYSPNPEVYAKRIRAIIGEGQK